MIGIGFVNQRMKSIIDKQYILNNRAVMSYKLIPNTKTISLKWEERMDVPIVNACSIIY
jgi:hypothetical protein